MPGCKIYSSVVSNSQTCSPTLLLWAFFSCGEMCLIASHKILGFQTALPRLLLLIIWEWNSNNQTSCSYNYGIHQTSAQQPLDLPDMFLRWCSIKNHTANVSNTPRYFFFPCYIIRESVDCLCRDGADTRYMQYIKQKPYNFATNMLKAYLSTQSV